MCRNFLLPRYSSSNNFAIDVRTPRVRSRYQIRNMMNLTKIFESVNYGKLKAKLKIRKAKRGAFLRGAGNGQRGVAQCLTPTSVESPTMRGQVVAHLTVRRAAAECPMIRPPHGTCRQASAMNRTRRVVAPSKGLCRLHHAPSAPGQDTGNRRSTCRSRARTLSRCDRYYPLRLYKTR